MMKNFQKPISIRIAKRTDIPRLTEIYNQAIMVGGITADLDPVSIDQRTNWFNEHSDDLRHPIMVAVDNNNEVIGYGYLSYYRPRRGVNEVAEVSYYFDIDYLGRGYGSAMLSELISYAKLHKIRVLLAILHKNNVRSIALLKKFGFEIWGELPRMTHDDHDNYYDQAIFGTNLE